MTRWAKAGSSQKHKKVPENSTPWEELSKDLKMKKNNKNHKIKESEFIVGEKNDLSEKNIYENSTKKEKYSLKEHTKFSNKKKKMKLYEDNNKTRSYINENFSQEESKHVIPSKDLELVKEQCFEVENSNSSKRHSKKFKEPVILSVENSNVKENSTDLKCSPKTETNISSGQRKRKKEYFLQKLKAKRKRLGIMLLPQKMENRLYRIKKSLRNKNFPPEKIKEIIREERKKAQNEFRKSNVTKTCFNCRQSGHLLVNCPQLSNLDSQETGICFKCGSTEHISAKCRKKVTGFPYASCFICKNQGHISRDCPENKHGIYPKGGKCNLCDSINHLRKDCPLLKKKDEEEKSITLHTIDEGKSVDDEIMDFQDFKQEKKIKKPKIVAF